MGKGGGGALRGISSKPLGWTTLLAALIVFSSVASAAGTQDINFGDLKRPASRSEKSWTLPGVSSEASGYLQQFSEIDDGRTSQRQTSRASASSSSTSYCGSSDTCFETVSTSGNPVKIRCTKGNNIGGERNLYGPDSHGKWANGMLGGYHRNFRETGNFACE